MDLVLVTFPHRPNEGFIVDYAELEDVLDFYPGDWFNAKIEPISEDEARRTSNGMVFTPDQAHVRVGVNGGTE